MERCACQEARIPFPSRCGSPADGRIKEFNRRKQELAHERAERSKAIRAVKHELSQRLRNDSPQRQRRAVGR